MKVIFLDIDGVLNSRRTAIAFERYGFIGDHTRTYYLDPIAVKLVEKLARMTDAKVVLSSSWRLGASKAEIDDVFRDTGIEIMDVTPSHLGPRTTRGDEIAAWLAKEPQVTHYVILDDDSDMTAEQKQGHFVHVNLEYGFSAENYYAAGFYLGFDAHQMR